MATPPALPMDIWTWVILPGVASHRDLLTLRLVCRSFAYHVARSAPVALLAPPLSGQDEPAVVHRFLRRWLQLFPATHSVRLDVLRLNPELCTLLSRVDTLYFWSLHWELPPPPDAAPVLARMTRLRRLLALPDIRGACFSGSESTNLSPALTLGHLRALLDQPRLECFDLASVTLEEDAAATLQPDAEPVEGNELLETLRDAAVSGRLRCLRANGIHRSVLEFLPAHRYCISLRYLPIFSEFPRFVHDTTVRIPAAVPCITSFSLGYPMMLMPAVFPHASACVRCLHQALNTLTALRSLTLQFVPFHAFLGPPVPLHWLERHQLTELTLSSCVVTTEILAGLELVTSLQKLDVTQLKMAYGEAAAEPFLQPDLRALTSLRWLNGSGTRWLWRPAELPGERLRALFMNEPSGGVLWEDMLTLRTRMRSLAVLTLNGATLSMPALRRLAAGLPVETLRALHLRDVTVFAANPEVDLFALFGHATALRELIVTAADDHPVEFRGGDRLPAYVY